VGIVGPAAAGHFMSEVFRVSTLKDGGASVILHVPYATADAAFELQRLVGQGTVAAIQVRVVER
jgi:hypothetical protein